MPPANAPDRRDLIGLREATQTWFAISLQTFGGPAGQIAVMQRVLVDQKKWIGQRRFLHALNYCMLLPGPEAQQLAVYIGWLLNGTRGGLIAGSLFILPGLLALLALSAIYTRFGDTIAVVGVFAGLAPAVLAIVIHALIRVAQRALTHRSLFILAGISFIALAALAIPYPVVIALAAAAGALLGRRFKLAAPHSSAPAAGDPAPVINDEALHSERPSSGRSLKILLTGLTIWLSPVAAVAWFLGRNHVLTQQGLFFSGTALVTFGGAYAVLAYVADRAVDSFGWLTVGEMAKGLALAETTPGPLIMVVQFVAFLGAYRNPGTLDPWVAAVLASFLTTWVTFVPSFIFILLGAPYVERLRKNVTLASALSGITAAVVGVIANLAVYFAIHALFRETTRASWQWLDLEIPRLGSMQWPALGIATFAGWLILQRGWSILRVLGICAVLGLTWQVIVAV